MTDAVAMPTPTNAVPKVGKTVAVALLLGLSIQLIGTLSWIALARLNVRVQPEIPWAAATMVWGLSIALVWLSGRGWPRRTSAFRRHHLRLWRPEPVGSPGSSCTSAGTPPRRTSRCSAATPRCCLPTSVPSVGS